MVFSFIIALLTTAPVLPDIETEPLSVHKVILGSSRPDVTDERPHGPTIIGAGSLKYDPDFTDYPIGLVRAENGEDLTLELGIRSDGSVGSCIAKSDGRVQQNRKVAKACNNLMAEARYTFADGYELKAPMGYLPVTLSWSIRAFPADPIELVSQGMGIKLRGYYKQTDCTIWSNQILDQEKANICDKLDQSEAFKKQLAADLSTNERGTTFTIWIAAAKPPQPPASLVSIKEDGFYTGFNPSPRKRFSYAVRMPSAPLLIKPDMGKFSMSLKNGDLSEKLGISFLSGMSGGQILVSIQPDGSVATCQLYVESGVAGMDLKACELAKATGRFVFSQGKEINSPHYMVLPLNWTL